MAKSQIPGKLKFLFTLLNIVIGWHLLYEGLIKLMDPNWSAAGYLMNAKGLLAGFFQGLAENPALLEAVNVINIAALILIGFSLMIGFYTRWAALAGSILIGLYYLANAPWSATTVGFASEGHYLVVNKNLVEAIALVVVASLPTHWYYGVSKLIPSAKILKTNKVDVPAEINHTPAEPKSIDRRSLVKQLVSLPFLGGFAFAVAKNHGWKSYEEEHLTQAMKGGTASTSGATVKISEAVDLSELEKTIPSGKIGDVEMGRLICGGNLISGYAHSRDLIYVSTFLKRYFTQKKIMDTFWLCEQVGVNTTAVSARPQEVELLQNYWKEGGKIQWLAPIYPKEDNYKENIDLAIDSGAIGAMIMGNVGDEWARDGKVELMAKTLDYIKSKGVIAGLAGHELNTFKFAEENQLEADFYMKTLHSKKYWSWNPDQGKDKMVIDNYAVDNYWSRQPEDTIRFMDQLSKPWIAFKILAAGAVHPQEGFRYAFENGADFACVGMFDWQVVENANLFNQVLDDQQFKRKRQWMA